MCGTMVVRWAICGMGFGVAQLVRATGSYPVGRRFESARRYQFGCLHAVMPHFCSPLEIREYKGTREHDVDLWTHEGSVLSLTPSEHWSTPWQLIRARPVRAGGAPEVGQQIVPE
jgi:hypothetical protein